MTQGEISVAPKYTKKRAKIQATRHLPPRVRPGLASHSQNTIFVSVRTVAHIFLVTLYCLVTVGMTVSTHFCAGIPVATGIGHPDAAEPDWCCGADEQDDGCCTTTVASFVVTDDHTISAAPSPTHIADEHCLALLPVPADYTTSSATYNHPVESRPGASPPLTILHHLLLI